MKKTNTRVRRNSSQKAAIPQAPKTAESASEQTPNSANTAPLAPQYSKSELVDIEDELYTAVHSQLGLTALLERVVLCPDDHHGFGPEINGGISCLTIHCFVQLRDAELKVLNLLAAVKAGAR